MNFRLIIFSILFSFVIITPMAYAQVLDQNSMQKSVKVVINSMQEVHVTHVIKSSDTPHQVDLIAGTISNLTIKDKQGEDLQFGTINENSVMIFPSKGEITIEYDLSNVLSQNNNFWLWDFLYLESTSFYFPEGVDLVFVDDKPAFLGDKKGIICHGCQMKLEYSLNEPKFVKEIKIQNQVFSVEFRTWSEINNFNFNKDLGGLSFQVEGDNSFVTTAIPKDLITEPYSVLLDNQKIFFHKYNQNDTHTWLNMRPQHSGEISIIGTVVPDIIDNQNKSGELPLEYLAMIFGGVAVAIIIVIFLKKKKD